VKFLYAALEKQFNQLTVSREEEGVGICAGAALAGAKPAMLVQSSGVGNMINALLSLTKLYELPLPILISWRGVYKESIPAQVPMGSHLPRILDSIDVAWTTINRRDDMDKITTCLDKVYSSNTIHAMLMSPQIWEDGGFKTLGNESKRIFKTVEFTGRKMKPKMRRYEVIKNAADHLKGKVVVCNLGVPCKELYSILDQDSNFYMLGSMGLASSIGLGISLNLERDVVVIDGDGSLLMNAGSLATIAVARPSNLTILAIDNGSHGSTGNQPTATRFGADLEAVARGFGFESTFKVNDADELEESFQRGEYPKFIHAIALPGNKDVPNIPFSPSEIKERFMRSII
jgi:sulfopyruvate decarboxylase subunit beta